jgi:hypothetical protein
LPRGRPTGRFAADLVAVDFAPRFAAVLAGRPVPDLAGRFAARFAGAGAAFRAVVFFLATLFCAVFRLAFAFGGAAGFRGFAVPGFAAPREGFAADGGFFRRDGAAAGVVGAAGTEGCAAGGFAAGGFAAGGFATGGFAGFRPDGPPGAGAGVAAGGVAVPPSPDVSAIDDQSASLWDWSVGGSAMLANRQRSRNLMSFSS